MGKDGVVGAEFQASSLPYEAFSGCRGVNGGWETLQTLHLSVHALKANLWDIDVGAEVILMDTDSRLFRVCHAEMDNRANHLTDAASRAFTQS